MYDKERINYIIKDELDLVSKKENEEFKLFYSYLRKIYVRCKKAGCHDRGRVFWEDFPFDLYTDIENWIDKNDMKEVKEYIDIVKEHHDCVRESAREFWNHWVSYRNMNKKKIG